MNLNDLFRFLPYQEMENRRSFTIFGKTTENEKFAIELRPQPSSIEPTGGFLIYGALEKTLVQDDVLFVLEGNANMGLGKISPANWELFFKENFKILFNDEVNESKKLVKLEKYFPKTLSYLRQFFDLEMYSQIVGNKKRISFLVKLSLPRIKDQYDQLYKYLKNMDNLFSINGSLQDKNLSEPSVSVKFDSSEREFFISFLIDENGELFSGKNEIEIDSIFDIELKFKGIHPTIKKWKHTVNLVKKNNHWQLVSKVLDLPESVAIQSNWLMTFPVWMAKKFLNLNNDLDDFFRTLQAKDGNKGFELALGVRSIDVLHSTIELDILFPFKDSFLVQTGFEMIASKINPKKKTMEEIEAVREGYLITLLEDLESEIVRSKQGTDR